MSAWRDRLAGERHFERHPYGRQDNPHDRNSYDLDEPRRHDDWDEGFRSAERRDEERRQEEDVAERRAAERRHQQHIEAEWEEERMMLEVEQRMLDEREQEPEKEPTDGSDAR